MKMGAKTCCNPNLGLATKVKVCKGVGQKWSPGIIFHVLKSVGVSKEMNSHTKLGSHFGNWNFDGFTNF
jgi:hypothetical protein